MNYGQLKAAVSAWTNRTNLTALMPTFLELTEQRIYNGSRINGRDTPALRTSDMLTVVNPFAGTLPTDWLEIKRLSWFSGTKKVALDYLPLERLSQMESMSGEPAYYSIRGGTVVYGPTFTNTVELIYYARPATPVADGDANILLTNASAIYLQGMLIEAGIYLRDPEMIAGALGEFRSAIIALQDDDDADQHSGAQMRMTPDQRRII